MLCCDVTRAVCDSDVIQDMDIWVTVSLFQAASFVGPTFLQPSTKDIIYWATFMKRTLKSPSSRFCEDSTGHQLDTPVYFACLVNSEGCPLIRR